jgi:SAM-dependent methyltransferase
MNNVPVGSKVADLGCGLGFLANELYKRRYRVTGIDVSVESIRFARSAFPRVKFEAVSVEDYATAHSSSFMACVANMFLHNSPYLEESLRAASRMLETHGILIATIPNPVFHLGYRADLDVRSRSAPATEFSIELPFRIKGGITHPGLVTYFHRDLATYYKALARAGLGIVDVDEPVQIGPGKPNDVLIILARKEG